MATVLLHSQWHKLSCVCICGGKLYQLDFFDKILKLIILMWVSEKARNSLIRAIFFFVDKTSLALF